MLKRVVSVDSLRCTLVKVSCLLTDSSENESGWSEVGFEETRADSRNLASCAAAFAKVVLVFFEAVKVLFGHSSSR